MYGDFGGFKASVYKGRVRSGSVRFPERTALGYAPNTFR